MRSSTRLHLGADPLDQACRYRVVIRGAEVAVRPDRRGYLLIPIAAGTIAVVAIAVLGSVTVLPALLSWLGPRSDAGRIPFLGRRREAARPSRAGEHWPAAWSPGR
jgi:hypothetical protein